MTKEELDEARLTLDKEKFDFERSKSQKDEASLTRRLTVSLALVGTLISLLTGAIQFYLNNKRMAQERDIALGKVLLEQGPKIYSDNEKERAYVIEVIKYTSPNQTISNNILGKFAAQAKDNAISNQIRAAQVIGKTEVPTAVAAASTSSNVNLPKDIYFEVGYTEKDTGLYHFIIKVRTSPASMALIKSVKYHINHPSFKNPDHDGNPKNNFSMDYDGWGAVDDIEAKVFLINGETMKTSINMIEQLRW
jgi:hypothetical protein